MTTSFEESEGLMFIIDCEFKEGENGHVCHWDVGGKRGVFVKVGRCRHFEATDRRRCEYKQLSKEECRRS